VESKDGFLYGLPINSSNLPGFDLITHTATLRPLGENWHGDQKWIFGVLTSNGHMDSVLFSGNQV